MVACTDPRPAFIPAANTAHVALNYRMGSKQMQNNLYFQRSAGISPGFVDALANEVAAQWLAFIAAVTSADVTLNNVVATDISVENGYQHIATTGLPSPGLVGVDAVPGNSTFTISFRTGFSGRSFRGRIYFIGLPNSYRTGDELNPTAITLYTDTYTDFFDAIETNVAGAEHVIVSYCSGGNWRTDAVVTPVNTYLVDAILDSQRRRLLGRGV